MIKRSSLRLTVFPVLIGLLLTACQSSSNSGDATTESVVAEKAMESPAQGPAFENINVDQFKKKMTEENTVILDVRTPAETQMGTIEGAMIIDITQSGFQEKIDMLDKNKTYLVYCKVGGRSNQACTVMAEAGFDHLFNLDGGYMAWSKEK